MSTRSSLVAITPAHDEADRIAALIASMAAQELPPDLWVIVDDASTDGTGSVAQEAIDEHGLDYATVLRRERGEGRSFSSKAAAVNAGWASVGEVDAQWVACIDADVVLPADYFAVVVAAFEADPALGATGGVYVHPVAGRATLDLPPPHHVPGPSQVFRRAAWDEIGGYWLLPHGGVDTAANVAVRMTGRTTRSLPDLVVDHSRRMGTGGGRHPVSAEFHKGCQDHDLGAHPLFQLGKVARRLPRSPLVVGALARLTGYLSGVVRRDRPVDADFVAFVRREQMARIRGRRGKQSA